MIRLIQRRLIIPRGDTGEFSIPVLTNTDTNSIAVFTIFDPLTQTKVFEKQIAVEDETLIINFTHADTVNLPVGKYVWDIKFYINPVFAENNTLIDGEEIDSYYAAFTLPICEIRQTGDNMLGADEESNSQLSPSQINMLNSAINMAQTAQNTAENAQSIAEEVQTKANSTSSVLNYWIAKGLAHNDSPSTSFANVFDVGVGTYGRCTFGNGVGPHRTGSTTGDYICFGKDGNNKTIIMMFSEIFGGYKLYILQVSNGTSSGWMKIWESNES